MKLHEERPRAKGPTTTRLGVGMQAVTLKDRLVPTWVRGVVVAAGALKTPSSAKHESCSTENSSHILPEDDATEPHHGVPPQVVTPKPTHPELHLIRIFGTNFDQGRLRDFDHQK